MPEIRERENQGAKILAASGWGKNTTFCTFNWRDNSAKGGALMPATKSFSNSLKVLIKLKSLIRAGFNYLKARLKHSRDKPHLLSRVWEIQGQGGCTCDWETSPEQPQVGFEEALKIHFHADCQSEHIFRTGIRAHV